MRPEFEAEPESLAPPLVQYALDMGLTVLCDLIEVESLPPHLRQGFTARPWPQHRLDKAIVDRTYIPPVPAVHSPEAWTLEIIHDRRIRAAGRSTAVQGARILTLFNILLLCRDVSLQVGDIFTLGFGAEMQNKADKLTSFHVLSRRLSDKVEPHKLFQEKQHMSRGGYRLNEAMRIVDRREF